MHNLKNIRKDLELFKKKSKDRNVTINFNDLLSLDIKNREYIQKKESLEQDKKKLSKSKEKINFEKSKNLSKEIIIISDKQKKIQDEINFILSNLPNIALPDVPIGADETKNIIIKKSGNVKSFNFNVKSIWFFDSPNSV